MRFTFLYVCLALISLTSGCAATDPMIPHLRKPISWTDSARRAQQDAYDRSAANLTGNPRNGARTGLMGTTNYIPGASSNPFAP